MSFGYRLDGYYDENGRWQRTKFCFVYCGERCTCMPRGPLYRVDLDTSKQVKPPPVEEDKDF